MTEQGEGEQKQAMGKGMWIGFGICMFLFYAFGPEKTEPGFSFTQVLYAAIAGGIGGAVGAAVEGALKSKK